MKTHAAAELFPLLDGDALAELAEDIKTNGLQEPVVLFDGCILDGRNRWAACKKAGVEPRTRTLARCDSPTAYVISANLRRRHLNELQRARVSARATPMFAAEAAKRKHEGQKAGGRGHKKLGGHGAPEVSGKATDQAAKATGAGQKSTKALVAIEKKAPDVGAAIDAGLITTVRDAERIANLEPEQRKDALRLVSEGETPREAVRQQTIAQIGKAAALPDAKFRVIYADPPWSYGNDLSQVVPRMPKDCYPVMPLDAICALDVAGIADDNAVLFLWTTSPILEESFQVIKAWGFKYKTSFVWDKVLHNMGHYNSVRHEFLLVCTRGKCQPDVAKLFDSVVTEERTEHSRKPETFRTIIDTIYPNGKRVELFCRGTAPAGWEVWGNECKP